MSYEEDEAARRRLDTYAERIRVRLQARMDRVAKLGEPVWLCLESGVTIGRVESGVMVENLLPPGERGSLATWEGAHFAWATVDVRVLGRGVMTVDVSRCYASAAAARETFDTVVRASIVRRRRVA